MRVPDTPATSCWSCAPDELMPFSPACTLPRALFRALPAPLSAAKSFSAPVAPARVLATPSAALVALSLADAAAAA